MEKVQIARKPHEIPENSQVIPQATAQEIQNDPPSSPEERQIEFRVIETVHNPAVSVNNAMVEV